MIRKKIFISLVSLFFLTTYSFAGEPTAKLRVDQWHGGMVSNALNTSLEPNQFASMLNVELSKLGEVSTRRGQALFIEDLGNTAFRGLGRFDPDKTTSYIVSASGQAVIQAQATDEKWTLTSPLSVLTSGKDTEFVQANDLLFVMNGFDRMHWWNGSNFTGGGIYPSSPPTATTGAWLRNYLFVAGATSNEDWVYFSNNENPLVFDSSDIIKVNTGDGQAVVHLEPYRLNELVVYKQRSIFVLDITGSTPLTDWTVQPISKVVGTIAPRSVVSLGNDQWFLSSEPIAIRSLVRSEFDKILVNIVSRPIQDIFDGTSDNFAINKTHIDKAAAILFDNKYLIAFPTGSSTVNNTVAVFNFITGGWYLITGWFPADWVVFDNRLFYIDANDSRVIECFTGTSGDIGDSSVAGNSFFGTASTPSVGINFQVVSRGIEFDFPENFKILDALEAEFGATGEFYGNIFINLDDSNFASIGSVKLSGDSRTLPLNLPFELATAGVARDTFQTQKYGEFKKMQFKISNSASQETVELHRVTLFPEIRPWRRR